MNIDQTTGESMIGGVSIRSWIAACIVIPGILTICWIAAWEKDVQWVVLLVSNVISWLFGKAGRAPESSISARVAVAAAKDSQLSAEDSEYSAQGAEDSANKASKE